MSQVLLKYIPESALPLVYSWYEKIPFHLKISKSRKTKYGDFRPAFRGKPNRISVNGDLNQYHFIITLTHEIAHAICWEKYQSKVSPHGKEWKSIYAKMLQELMEVVTFPKEIHRALLEHLKNPKASSCSDPTLFKVLENHNKSNALVYLEDIGDNALFRLQGRTFQRKKKRRTRFECIELKTGKPYLISGHAAVNTINEKNINLEEKQY